MKKKSIVLCLISVMLLCSACGKGEKPEEPLSIEAAPDIVSEDTDISADADVAAEPTVETETSEEVTSSFQLTEAGKGFLQQMCYYLPEFSDSANLNDQFWSEFLFLSYTGQGDDKYELVEVKREDLGSELQVKVSKDEAAAYVKLALGIDLPAYEPKKEDLLEGQTGFYYQDGFYYVGVSDFGDIAYEYKGMSQLDDNTVLVEYQITDGEKSDLGTAEFTLKPADNENGFVITGRR